MTLNDLHDQLVVVGQRQEQIQHSLSVLTVWMIALTVAMLVYLGLKLADLKLLHKVWEILQVNKATRAIMSQQATDTKESLVRIEQQVTDKLPEAVVQAVIPAILTPRPPGSATREPNTASH